MNKLLSIVIILMLPLAAHSFDGYVHGNNHCFYFSSPQSWIADNVSGKQSGLPFVFYQSNSSWANAKTVIYTRVMDKSETIKVPIDVVNDTLNSFHIKYGSPNSKAEYVDSTTSVSGAEAKIYKFTGDKFGNTELVAYFLGENTINYFVMTSRDSVDLDQNKDALIELSNTYKESNDCVPCSEKTHNKSPNLAQNANALCAG